MENRPEASLILDQMWKDGALFLCSAELEACVSIQQGRLGHRGELWGKEIKTQTLNDAVAIKTGGSARSRRSAVTLHQQLTFVGLFYEHSDCWWCWTDNFQTFGVVCCRPRLFSFGVLSASALENSPEGPPKKDTACLCVPHQSLVRYSWTELWKYPIRLEINVRLCCGEISSKIWASGSFGVRNNMW